MRYYEDDWIAEVEVVKDKSNEEYISYDLKVIKTIQESNIYKPTPNGTIFNFTEIRNMPGIVGKLESKQ